jgi:hypothetical protein
MHSKTNTYPMVDPDITELQKKRSTTNLNITLLKKNSKNLLRLPEKMRT